MECGARTPAPGKACSAATCRRWGRDIVPTQSSVGAPAPADRPEHRSVLLEQKRQRPAVAVFNDGDDDKGNKDEPQQRELIGSAAQLPDHAPGSASASRRISPYS